MGHGSLIKYDVDCDPDGKDDSDEDASHKNGMVSATYFVNWAIYARSHFPWQVPMDSLTHVFYAFANVRPESGEVYLTDSWADEQIHWADRGDSWNDQGNNLYGCFNQFRQLKQKHRNLKLLLSIGGWTYSSNFAPGTDSPEKRAKFSSSALGLLEDYGLDGLDIDWEYPTSDKEADQLVQLLKHMRKDLDSHQKSKKDKNPYLLTIAAPCGPQHFRQLHLKQMSQYLSFINLMAYDYAGSWDTIAGHQANLRLPNSEAVNQGNFSTVAAVNYYLEQSVPARKIVIGMPLYGRSFLNTKGIGHSYNGVGQGNWESGIYDYKSLPKDNCKLMVDKKAIGAYTYDKSAQELITFDNPTTVNLKVDYVRSKNLGGVMWWESSGDKNISGEALIPMAASKLGSLDNTYNHLKYPGSKWDNLRGSALRRSSLSYKGSGQQSNKHHHHSTSHHKDRKVSGSY
ncbi:family 18 glycoside hydrolase [Phakopsora pachyrhizi]|uniref:chitinase n=1 Tax=Phakopsora pachyrhizi TaxID=170000 RepID=A0AAV0ASM0_PHAPC|nr:family 18 glycoside hydrolase [Phakopsora pachyrhizi]